MELFAADGHDAGGCERVTGKSGMRPLRTALRRALEFEARAPAPRSAEEAEQCEVELAQFRGHLSSWRGGCSQCAAGIAKNAPMAVSASVSGQTSRTADQQPAAQRDVPDRHHRRRQSAPTQSPPQSGQCQPNARRRTASTGM